MSDYLWDRTGGGDAEVERLETLLGAFAHEARPLKLPAEASVAAAPRRSGLDGFAERLRASRLFAPGGLAAAAAASALVLFGAAAWLSRARPEGDGARPAARSQEAAHAGVAPKSSAPAPRAQESGAASHAHESVARADGVKAGASKAAGLKVEKTAVESLAGAPLGRKGSRAAAAVAAAARRKPARVERDGGAADEVFTFEAMRSGGASALVENTRLLTKEQLVHALRLTGAKLRDVRQKAQGSDGPEARPR